jgi:hypothetical protein
MLLGIIFGSILLLAGASVGLAVMFAGSSAPPPGPTGDDRQTRGDSTLRQTTDAGRLENDSGHPDRYVAPPEKKEDPPPQPILRTILPPEDQAKVDKAIDKGVAHLKKTQLASGTWKTNYHPVGCAALPALTLLECGVPADDPIIQKAAKFVRSREATLTQTYQISLAILFLDRLGDPKDRELIQTLGVRLIAGQLPSGGWTYQCTAYNKRDSMDVLLVLEKTRPATTRELHLEISSTGESKPVVESTAKEQLEKAVKGLPRDLQKIPAVQPPEEKPAGLGAADRSDNSNTQFGLLGVWVAGRHGVPTERCLSLVARRFRVSQTKRNTWGYHFAPKGNGPDTTPAMTAAGLLGLAVGHGLSAGESKDEPARKKVEDPAIKKGLQALGEHIGKPLGAGRKVNQRGKELAGINLYFLWSVERVAVLYNLPKINDKDWYAWGAELLVDHQEKEGHWKVGGYAGANELIDTCFALLFLKRANLVKDLTNKVEFIIDSK